MKKIIGFLLVVILLGGISFFLIGYKKNTTIQNNSGENKINVMVSILPQVDFVQRIGGDKVMVSEMIPPGFSPATYDPSPEQLKKLQLADIYFRIGHIAFEKSQMKKLENLNSKMTVIDTSKSITLLELATHSHEEDEHKEDEYEAGDDPHIWLSPKLVKIQAKHIYESLVKFKPTEKEYFLANYNKFIKDLNKLDVKLKNTFTSIKGKTILVFHPAFGYLANEYGFTQEAIEIEGKDPSPEHLKEIIDEAKADKINVIFVQKQFSTKNAEAIAKEIKGVVIQIDPLTKNYFDNLEKMSDTIVKVLK